MIWLIFASAIYATHFICVTHSGYVLRTADMCYAQRIYATHAIYATHFICVTHSDICYACDMPAGVIGDELPSGHDLPIEHEMLITGMIYGYIYGEAKSCVKRKSWQSQIMTTQLSNHLIRISFRAHTQMIPKKVGRGLAPADR